MSATFSSFVELLTYRATHQSEKAAFIFLEDGTSESSRQTFQDLDRQARTIAGQLQKCLKAGDRVLLLYPSGIEFISAFLGCLYAGMVAVPAYPPRPNRKMERLQSIVSDCKASAVLTTEDLLVQIDKNQHKDNALQDMEWLAHEVLIQGSPDNWKRPLITTDTLAFLQYTSGSTGNPKGVMVSQGNLIHNEQMLEVALCHTEESIYVSWLPLFHDMGLIGNVLQSLYIGIPCVLMSPVSFLQKPARWLQAISNYRATISGGPNFAYDLCANKISSDIIQTLDLSNWKIAFNGAEPVRAETLERFSNTFAPAGFRQEAFFPCYGMAETTLFVTGGLPEKQPVFCEAEKGALEENIIVPPISKEDCHRLVSCGRTWLEETVVIANPDSLESRPDGHVGEIWVASNSVAKGYWNRPEATQKTFQAYLADTGKGPFLRTGDLGFLKEEELFVTGRIKDLLIIRGRNHYPQDIEHTVEMSHSALRPGAGAAFVISVNGVEHLAIVQEVERTAIRKLNADEVIETVRKAVSNQHELQVSAIILLKTGRIPQTSSGKIQRHACRTGFLTQRFAGIKEWQSPLFLADQEAEQRTEIVDKNVSPRCALPQPSNQLLGIHNALYGPARVLPLPVSLPDEQAIDSKVRSTHRANHLREWLRDYNSDRINSRLMDERRCIPPHVVLDFGNHGLLGMQIPQQYGGLELSTVDTLRIFEQLAAIDLSLASFVGVNHALGTRPILNFASRDVKAELLPLLAKGIELGSFAITEPGAGSNPRAMQAKGTAQGPGRWNLNGQKVWIGSASWSGILNVFVQLLDDKKQPLGITGFTVRQGTQGLVQGPEALTMGMRGMVQNAVHFNDMLVHTEQILGEVGSGMSVAQDSMMFGRLGIGAMSIGGMKRCAQLMMHYAERRSISTGRLLDNAVTRIRISELTAAVTAVEALVFKIAHLLDCGKAVPAEAYTACKTTGPELVWKAADHLIQMLGGRGYIETNSASQFLRDARLLRIFEGPTETLNMFLGMRVINQSASLETFISQDLKAPKIFARLQDAAEQIKARYGRVSTPFSDTHSANQWAITQIGELASWSMLLAAVKGSTVSGEAMLLNTDRLQFAADWAQHQFELKLEQALVPAETTLTGTDASTLKTVVTDFAEQIGLLDQSLAGEDYDLDNLLRQRTTQTTAPSPVASPAAVETLSQPEPSTATPTTSPSPMVSHQAVERIETWIINWLSQKLKIATQSIQPDKSFADYGIDSMMAVDLSFELGEWIERALDATILWNFPTIEALASHLATDAETSGEPTDEVKPLNEPLENASETLDDLSESEMAALLASELKVD